MANTNEKLVKMMEQLRKIKPWMWLVCGALLCLAAVIFFTDTGGDSVTVRLNPFYFLPLGGILLCAAFATYAGPPLKKESGETMTRWQQSLRAFLFCIVGNLLLIVPFVSSTTIDGKGITGTLNKPKFTPWDAVTEVDYNFRRGGYRRINSDVFIIRHSSGRIKIEVNLLFTNSKEALKIVARNVPNDRFTNRANIELKDIGIWTKYNSFIDLPLIQTQEKKYD